MPPFLPFPRIQGGLGMVLISINTLLLWLLSTSACEPSDAATATGNSSDLSDLILLLGGANIPMNYLCPVLESPRAPECKQALSLHDIYGAEASGEERAVLGLVSFIGPRKGIVCSIELCSNLWDLI